jgi:exonuclease III
LKALKTAEGERFRHSQAQQLLQEIQNILQSSSSERAAVLVTGDLNASPRSKSYPSTVYELLKSQESLPLRSALNDDLLEHRRKSRSDYGEDEIWTTWKARRNKHGKESVVRHCVDYILYNHGRAGRTTDPSIPHYGFKAKAVLDGFKDREVDETLLPSSSYPSDHIAIGADLELIRFT